MAMTGLAKPGENCWKTARADKVAVIVDAADYFRIIHQAMLEARHRIMIVGWDFDTRIELDPEEAKHLSLGRFILELARARPEIEIRILKWDFGAIKSLFRGSHLVMLARWAMTRAIRFKFDSAHPPGCSHHQKIVVIDDCLAVCGGIDMTADRWDTREHKDDDPRRVEPSGKSFGPWHDATALISGNAAAALAELSRDRWERATGEPMKPVEARADCWVDAVEPHFENVDLAIARTRAEFDGANSNCPEVREIEALFLDMIARAEKFIYAENQYFTSSKIAAAIAQRMQEENPPEIVIVGPLTADGWIEQVAMDGARVRLCQLIGKSDVADRFRIYYPCTQGGEPIYVHAKIMIVDDRLFRIGSANMNNRSLGLDSECDVLIDVATMAGETDDGMKAIRSIRESLMAEHLGVEPEQVRDAFDRSGSLHAVIAELRGEGRMLKPIPMDEPEGIEKFIADNQVLDPECADEFFEPLSKRGLMNTFFARARRSRGFVHRRKRKAST